VVIGEGGSGGALGIGIGDRMLILENSYFSVISPEGCAAILWRSSEHSAQAAVAMKVTAAEQRGSDGAPEHAARPGDQHLHGWNLGIHSDPWVPWVPNRGGALGARAAPSSAPHAQLAG